MTTLAPLVPRAVTLDEFIALSDEIAALARAGVPLGPGLLALSRDLPARLGKIVEEVGNRLESGETLEQVVSRSPGLFPPVYRAVIEAGIRVGRLPAALEHVSRTARRTAELRRGAGLALVYPLAVMALAYGLFLFWLWFVAPVLAGMFDDIGPATKPLWDAVLAARGTMIWWAPVPPLIAIAWCAWFWWRSGRVAWGLELHPLLGFGGIGTLLAMRRASRLSALTELLAMLVEHGVPLERSIPLAAEATGDRRLLLAANDLAGRLSRGEASTGAEGLPPLLTWALLSGQLQGDLPQVLRRMSRVYAADAARRAEWLAVTRPVLVTALVGGLTVVPFAAVHLAPFIAIIYKLSEAVFYA